LHIRYEHTAAERVRALANMRNLHKGRLWPPL